MQEEDRQDMMIIDAGASLPIIEDDQDLDLRVR